MHGKAFFLLPTALLLLLTGCGYAPTPQPVKPAEPSAAVTDGAVPGDEPVNDAMTDGLEGSYYNDYLRMTLTLDGRGACTLTGADTDAAGTYTASADGLLLDFGTRQENAVPDARGDITIDGRAGYFLRDWDFWGISETEAGIQPAAPGGTETLSNADGSFRYRDYGCHVACTCAKDMEILPDLLSGAVAVSDGNGSYVTGRNVTDVFNAFSGDAEAFLEDYIKTFAFADFDVLYGGLSAYADLSVFSGDTSGRLSAATLRLRNDDHDVTANIILYTSAYSDGTENYICKSYFAPAANAARLDALADAVTDMGAVRVKPQS